MKDKKIRSKNQTVKYQIVQRYFGEDEVLSEIHKDKELTYPKKFDSPDDAQELIDITLQRTEFKGWNLEVIAQCDEDQLLDQDEDTCTFEYRPQQQTESAKDSRTSVRKVKRGMFD